MQRPPIKIGVMGSASTSISAEDLHRVDDLAKRLGQKLAAASCVLITGELDGIPGRVVEVHSQHGGLSVGISPASSAVEHAALYGTPPCPSTVVIYSGFGFKGRNVIAVRSADIVLLFSGGIGTLNEFTIAYDEGKVIGLLQGHGGRSGPGADAPRHAAGALDRRGRHRRPGPRAARRALHREAVRTARGAGRTQRWT